MGFSFLVESSCSQNVVYTCCCVSFRLYASCVCFFSCFFLIFFFQDLVKTVLSPAMVSMKNIPEDTMQFGKSKVGTRADEPVAAVVVVVVVVVVVAVSLVLATGW